VKEFIIKQTHKRKDDRKDEVETFEYLFNKQLLDGFVLPRMLQAKLESKEQTVLTGIFLPTC